MKDIKHIRRDFHSVAWVMPQGSDLGVPWGVEWSKKFFFRNSTRFGVWVTYISATCNDTIFWVPTPWGGAKRSNIIKSQSQSQFQRFLNQTLCVFSQLKDIKHIRRDFHSVAWVMPQGWDLGVPWGVGGSKNFFSQIQPDLVCELLTWMAHATAQFFSVPASLGLGEGQKGQISLNLNYKVNFKDF